MATAQQEIKALKKELADIKATVAEKAKEADPSTEDRFNMESVKVRARQAGKKARELFEETQGQAKVAREKTEKTIQDRPFASAAVAFAGGALVATLINRK